jgi:peptide/nickel transport system substrate-binding protein
VKLNYAEPLVSLDKDNQWIPCLAEDWRWLNEKTIEFRLRRGVTFHNGEDFDAEAVRVNWEAYRNMANPIGMRLEAIPDDTAFETVGKYFVRFTFPEPDGLAFVRFAWFFQFAPGFFAEHRFAERHWGYLPRPPSWGTGPFVLVEQGARMGSFGDRIVLEANTDYWDPRYPKVKRVIFDNTLIEDRKAAMRLCAETEGAVDILSFIRPLDTLRLAESRFAKVIKNRDVSALIGRFNQRKEESKWNDVRLRKAVNYAINRKELWEYAAKGNASNLGGYIPAGAVGHNPDLNLYRYDTSEAEYLLADSGYPNGFDAKIIAPEALELEAKIIAKMLRRIGIRATVDTISVSALFERVFVPFLSKPEEQDWDIYILTFQDWYGHTGFSFLAWYTEEGDFRWNAYDNVYERMWKEMSRSLDAEVQGLKIRQMQRYLYDQAYAIFIYSPLSLFAVNDEVNFVPQKNGYLRLKETSVTEKHWSLRGKNN